MTDSNDVVLLEVSEHIATITLNRPEARNALSSEVLRLLPQRMREANDRDDVDVIVLTGTDPAFCAGLDLKELGSSAPQCRWCARSVPDGRQTAHRRDQRCGDHRGIRVGTQL